MPQYLRNVVNGLCTLARAFGRFGPVEEYLFDVVSGVMQGCLFSGTALSIAMGTADSHWIPLSPSRQMSLSQRLSRQPREELTKISQCCSERRPTVKASDPATRQGTSS